MAVAPADRQASAPPAQLSLEPSPAETGMSEPTVLPGTETRADPANTAEPVRDEPLSQPEPGVSDTGADPTDVQPSPQPDPPVLTFVREAELPGGGSFRLDGIAWSSDRPFALVNGEVIGPGGIVNGASVIEVAPDRVTLARDGQRFQLTLR